MKRIFEVAVTLVAVVFMSLIVVASVETVSAVKVPKEVVCKKVK